MTRDPVRAGALRAWPIRVAGGRLLRQWRLLLLVLAVALIASTAVTSIGLLVTATESSAVRSALRAIPAAQSEQTVNVEQASSPIAKIATAAGRAVARVAGAPSVRPPTIRAYSAVGVAALPGGAQAATYLGELDGVRSNARLVSGEWATTVPGSGSRTVDVDLPASAASALGIRAGSIVTLATPSGPVTAHIVGIYDIPDPHALFWSQDPLEAAGHIASYESLESSPPVVLDAFGPLLVAPGTMDALDVLADRLELDYSSTFENTAPDALPGLIDRLQTAPSVVPEQIGDVAGQVTDSGSASAPIGQIAAALVVTRSSVIVIELLLAVLAIAALAQAARLFTDARAGDRQLMRARGASRAQVVGMAAIEAAVVGLITAAASAPLARLVYLVAAAQSATRAAQMPRDAGMPASTWLTGAALGLVFVLVLLGSVLAAPVGFVAAEQQRSRGRRATGLLRSGLDLGIVALASVAFWQLVVYKSPVEATSSLAVDPVLVAAPALVLLAGALLCARLIPLLARLADGLAGRSRGALLPLAGWEVGRRSRRIGAVVLLLTLALAVGAFGQTFLATWHQSQLDQASFAVGPSVRVPADASESWSQQSVLRKGATGQPQPSIRRVADVLTAGEQAQEDAKAVVMGLTPGARAMLERGRENADGGAVIAHDLHSDSPALAGLVLPGSVRGIAASARVGTPGQRLPGVSADLVVIVEDASGVLETVDLGTIPVDGQVHAVTAALPAAATGEQPAAPLRIVGMQSSIFMSNEALFEPNPQFDTTIALSDVVAIDRTANGSATRIPATAGSGIRWYGGSAGVRSTSVQVTGGELGLAVTVPQNLQFEPPTYILTAWKPVSLLPAVVSAALASSLDAHVGDHLELQFDTAGVSIEVAAISSLIPGATDSTLLTAASAAGADATPTPAVVVDQGQLQRALVQGGEAGSMVDEWWVNVAPGHGQAYLAAHPAHVGALPARSSDVLAARMQDDPLRVATQSSLWLAIAAAALLAAIGFAVHSASTMAARRVEFAQLRAIGLSRRRLVALIGVESALLGILGTVFGLGVGVLLGVMTGPLIALSPNGEPAVPPVVVTVPWLDIAALVLVVAIVLVAVIGGVARAQRFANPANILREADNG